MNPRYADLIKMPIEKVRAFLKLHPGHIGAENALQALQQEMKAKAKLDRIGRRQGGVEGWTKTRFSYSGSRCPTKRELR